MSAISHKHVKGNLGRLARRTLEGLQGRARTAFPRGQVLAAARQCARDKDLCTTTNKCLQCLVK